MSRAHEPTILLVAPYGFNDRLTNYIEFVTGRLLARNGWRVYAIARHEKDEAEESVVEGVRVTRYESTIQGAWRLVGLFFRTRPDVVHVHNLRNNQIGFLAAILAQLFRTPLLFSEYGLPHDHYLSENRDDPYTKPFLYENVVTSLGDLLHRIARHPRGSAAHVRNYLFHYPLFAARTVVFVSKHNVPIAKKLGIRDTRYIPYIVDDVRWSIDSERDSSLEARVRGLAPGRKALFVGQFKDRKGWKTFLNAIPEVPSAVISVFVLVTPSSDRSEYDSLVKKLRIENRVALFERIPGPILRDLFAVSDMVVVPSLYEGFGLVPLEAFESEKPVIASRVEALTDFLTNGENALLASPNDAHALARAIRKLADDSELRERLVRGGNKTLNDMRGKEAHAAWLALFSQYR